MTSVPLSASLDNVPMHGNANNEENLNKFGRFQLFSNTAFIIANMVFASLVTLAMIIIRHSDAIPLRMINMTTHCNDTEYNMDLIQSPNKFLPYCLVITMTFIVFATTVSKTFIMTPKKAKATRKIFGEIFKFGVDFLLFCLTMEIIKLITGIPSPDYFSHKDLQDYYCFNESTVNKTLSKEMEALDKSLRRSFPSYQAAISSYCTTFLYLYFDHIDISNGLHASQQLILFLFGTFSIHHLKNRIEFGENHVEDVIAGVIIGFFYAIVTIRNLFGTILYQRTHPSIAEEKQCDYQPTDDESSSLLCCINCNSSKNSSDLKVEEPVELCDVIVTTPENPVRSTRIFRVCSVTQNLSTSFQ